MPERFPLFKGPTRVATFGGVPLVPLLVMNMAMGNAAALFGIGWLALIAPGWLLMAQVTRSDDRAFRILWLWLRTKVANQLRMLSLGGQDDYWGASTYAVSDGRRRSWEGEGGRWGG